MVHQRLASLGVAVPAIMLPAPGVDLDRWGVVACDQYTAQPEYWMQAYEKVGGEPSTLAMILPEAFLGTERAAHLEREGPINMQRYLDEGVLTAREPGMILVERDLGGRLRSGLMLALDLERYDYGEKSQSLIRATEKTIVERIPPRMKIRRQAPLELPHIMVLIDDPQDRVLQAARGGADRTHPLYTANLMLGGGRVSGYAVKQRALEPIADALEALAAGQEHPMLFAMGDGNHSLATAKACWEELKLELQGAERENHPARYALVEVVNLHDPALTFEPIHRVVFDTNPQACLDRLEAALNRAGCPTRRGPGGKGCPIGITTSAGMDTLWLEIAPRQLPVSLLQPALDEALDPKETLDFIHGEDTVRSLCAKEGRLGLVMPPFDKGALFPTVQVQGPLPRKSFSMGEAHEKRYYFECRRIRNI